MARTTRAPRRVPRDADALDVYQPDAVLAVGLAPRARPRPARARARARVHAAHLDERHRPPRQPAPGGRRRRRPVPRVPVRPAGLDARAARLHARGAAAPRRRRLHPAFPTGRVWESSSTRTPSAATRSLMPSYDVHQHLWPAALVAASAAAASSRGSRRRARARRRAASRSISREHRLDRRLELLDRDGIDVAVVSLPPTLGWETRASSPTPTTRGSGSSSRRRTAACAHSPAASPPGGVRRRVHLRPAAVVGGLGALATELARPARCSSSTRARREPAAGERAGLVDGRRRLHRADAGGLPRRGSPTARPGTRGAGRLRHPRRRRAFPARAAPLARRARPAESRAPEHLPGHRLVRPSRARALPRDVRRRAARLTGATCP